MDHREEMMKPSDSGSDKKYQASSNFIYRKVAGADVLISVGSNIADFNGYIQLNNSALGLWKALEEPKTVRQLETMLEKNYGISRERAAEDVEEFLKELEEHDMVMTK